MPKNQVVKDSKVMDIKLLKELADKGDAYAENYLGLRYLDGTDIKQDIKNGVLLIQKSAAQGNSYGQNSLGICYQEGIGVKQDIKMAIFWYQKAAEKGDSIPENNLASCYMLYEETKDVRMAVALYKNAAKKGQVDAQVSLGYIYSTGNEVEPKNITKAAFWYQQAADQGDPVALYELAHLYKKGEGVPQSLEKAVELLQKAADKGDKNAVLELESMKDELVRHYSDNREYEKAVKLCYKIIENPSVSQNSHGKATEILASCYYSGNGVDCNYIKAANFGHVAAFELLVNKLTPTTRFSTAIKAMDCLNAEFTEAFPEASDNVFKFLKNPNNPNQTLFEYMYDCYKDHRTSRSYLQDNFGGLKFHRAEKQENTRAAGIKDPLLSSSLHSDSSSWRGRLDREEKEQPKGDYYKLRN